MNRNRQLAQASSKKTLENKEEEELQGEMNMVGNMMLQKQLHYCFSVWVRLTPAGVKVTVMLIHAYEQL